MAKAKIFNNGRSQAVRLPVQFRFDVNEVYVRRDERTGDVILSKKPADWSEFWRARGSYRRQMGKDSWKIGRIRLRRKETCFSGDAAARYDDRQRVG